MLNYEKLTKSTRTMVATVLLMVFMALVVTDLFISFFGGVLLGVLLMQFALEVRIFFRHRLQGTGRPSVLIRSYESLPDKYRRLLRLMLLALLVVLVIFEVANTFWGGLVLGILSGLIANEILMYRQSRNPKAIARK